MTLTQVALSHLVDVSRRTLRAIFLHHEEGAMVRPLVAPGIHIIDRLGGKDEPRGGEGLVVLNKAAVLATLKHLVTDLFRRLDPQLFLLR